MKRIVAGIMAFVFSLNMISINVNAEVRKEEPIAIKEDAVLKKEDIKEAVEYEDGANENNAKKVLVKAADGAIYLAKIVGNDALVFFKVVGSVGFDVLRKSGSGVKFVLKEFLRGVSVSTGVASVIACLCAGCTYVVIKTNENVRKGGRNPFGYLYQEWCEFKRSAAAGRWEQECGIQ